MRVDTNLRMGLDIHMQSDVMKRLIIIHVIYDTCDMWQVIAPKMRLVFKYSFSRRIRNSN